MVPIFFALKILPKFFSTNKVTEHGLSMERNEDENEVQMVSAVCQITVY